MVGLSVFIAIAFTRLPISRSRNIARTAKASTRLIASKFQDYRCDTKWDTVCDTRQHKRHRCLTYGWFFLTYRSASLFIKPRFCGVFAFWAGCHAWWRCAYQAYWGRDWFCRPDKVFTPPSGRGFTASIEIGFRGCRRLFPSYLIFISLLFMHRVSFIWGECVGGYF